MVMDHYTEHLEDWKKACKISAKALEYGKTLVVKGANALDICKKVDEMIIDLGGTPAFPSQISLNEVAAHFCPIEDVILDDEVVKLDVGAAFNDAIGDNACTVDLSGKHEDLVNASRKALNEAVKIIKPGLKIKEIGKVISENIKKHGFIPISNLSGHGLDYNSIHCSPTIPNFDNGNENELEEGMIFAIEPFATDGAGKIYESGEGTVFSQTALRPVRNPVERTILRDIDRFKGKPFSMRDLIEKYSLASIKVGLKGLERQDIVRSYPPLVEVEGGMVSQAEHTVLVTKNGCEVLTKI